MACTGRWTPEQRAKLVAEAAAMPAGAAKRDAIAKIEADDVRAPIPALMQLAWGHL